MADSLRLVLDANVIIHLRGDPLTIDWPRACGVGAVDLVLTEAVLRELDEHARNYNKPRTFQERARKRRDRLVEVLRSKRPSDNQRAGVALSYEKTGARGDEGILEALATIAGSGARVGLASYDKLLSLRAEHGVPGVVVAAVPDDEMETFESRETVERLRDLTTRTEKLESTIAGLVAAVGKRPKLGLVRNDGLPLVWEAAWRYPAPPSAEVIEHYAQRALLREPVPNANAWDLTLPEKHERDRKVAQVRERHISELMTKATEAREHRIHFAGFVVVNDGDANASGVEVSITVSAPARVSTLFSRPASAPNLENTRNDYLTGHDDGSRVHASPTSTTLVYPRIESLHAKGGRVALLDTTFTLLPELESPFAAEVRVMADNLDEPVVDRLRFDIVAGGLPKDWLE
jgi:rRNA-processing protein FCF1